MHYRALGLDGDTRIPPGITDLRGYDVRVLAEDVRIGRVHELIVDEDERLRFLDVDTGGFFRPKHVIVPIELAEVDPRDEAIWVSATRQQLDALPDYLGDAASIGETYESRVRELLAGGSPESDRARARAADGEQRL